MAGRAAPSRQNEYFVPRDGIDREVITADICRYLGNDALVRPGTYENKETGRVIQGYYINAYRNLTTAMIEDLKEASRLWAVERSRVNGAYRHSETHQRQQGGMTPAPEYAGYQAQAQYGQPTPAYPPAPAQYGQQAQYPGQGNYPYQAQAPPRSPPPRMENPYGAPNTQPRGFEPAYAPGANRPMYESQRDPYGNPAGGYPPTTVPQQHQQPGYVAAAPGQQQYFAQQGQPSYVPQAQVQPQDPFIGRSSKGQPPFGSPEPGYDDQSGRTVTPTSNTIPQQPPPQQTQRPRDSRNHYHRQHKH